MYITPQDELHVDFQGIALSCPHCQTMTHLTEVATPRFEELSRRKPKHVGIVFRCDACEEPVFLKFVVKAYTALRVELSANYVEIERARENFPLTYLPKEAEELFKEALDCYAAGCFNAFGAMSRRTAQSLFRDLGERGKLGMFDTMQEIRTLAELDDDTFATVRAVLFGSDSDPWPHQPHLNAQSAGVLLEVMRDLLYQTFVRKARLLQAMTFRKFVAPAQAEAG
jgi:thiol-disulfide isomerase/thioredoxin